MQALLWWLGLVRAAHFLVTLLVAILLGLEGATLRRWTLRRRGFRNVGVVVGDDLEEAERRFFGTWVARDHVQPAPPPQAPPAPPTGPRVPRAHSDVVGLFPEPGAPR